MLYATHQRLTYTSSRTGERRSRPSSKTSGASNSRTSLPLVATREPRIIKRACDAKPRTNEIHRRSRRCPSSSPLACCDTPLPSNRCKTPMGPTLHARKEDRVVARYCHVIAQYCRVTEQRKGTKKNRHDTRRQSACHARPRTNPRAERANAPDRYPTPTAHPTARSCQNEREDGIERVPRLTRGRATSLGRRPRRVTPRAQRRRIGARATCVVYTRTDAVSDDVTHGRQEAASIARPQPHNDLALSAPPPNLLAREPHRVIRPSAYGNIAQASRAHHNARISTHA